MSRRKTNMAKNFRELRADLSATANAASEAEYQALASELSDPNEDAEFRASLQRGITQAKRGETMSHEDVKARIKDLLKR